MWGSIHGVHTKYTSKGGIPALYQYEMATTQLSKTLERNQQRAAIGRDRRQVQFTGRTTSGQASEEVERRFQEELQKIKKHKIERNVNKLRRIKTI